MLTSDEAIFARSEVVRGLADLAQNNCQDNPEGREGLAQIRSMAMRASYFHYNDKRSIEQVVDMLTAHHKVTNNVEAARKALELVPDFAAGPIVVIAGDPRDFTATIMVYVESADCVVVFEYTQLPHPEIKGKNLIGVRPISGSFYLSTGKFGASALPGYGVPVTASELKDFENGARELMTRMNTALLSLSHPCEDIFNSFLVIDPSEFGSAA